VSERQGCHAAASAPAAVAAAARAAQRRLAIAGGAARSRVLEGLAAQLDSRRGEILAANARDLATAEAEGIGGALLGRLGLDDGKIDGLADGVVQLARMQDPVGRCLEARRLDDGLELRRVSHPLGVLLVIFESRPDALVQIGSLGVRSANGLILKGGREAALSNRILTDCLRTALAAVDEGIRDAVQQIEGRDAVQAFLAMPESIDLVIPRGSGELVRRILDATRIPVLGHAEGVCHIFVDEHATLETAIEIVLDAKCSYPSACNAVETLLVHRGWLDRLPRLLDALSARGVALRGDERVRAVADDVAPAAPADWREEYGDLILAIRCVDDVGEAIDHVHRYGSGHTDAVISEDEAVCERFLREVDSASVFANASTRFADGYRYGLGAEVGISTSRLHARGPVGIDGLLTTRWLLRGTGQSAARYGPGGRAFLHTPLPPDGD
jgi:glutamate-5-semialdehyde dehydrogenase